MIKSASQSSLLNDKKYTSMATGNVPSNEYLIETVVLGSTTSSVTFSNLSQYAGVYRHLQVVFSARSTRGTVSSGLRIRFNSDSGSNYNCHILFGNGTSVTGDYYSSSTIDYIAIDRIAAANAASNAFGCGYIDIAEAFSTSKRKTVRSSAGVAGLGGQDSQVFLTSGAWGGTSAVDSITLYEGSGASLTQYSRFSIYGVTA